MIDQSIVDVVKARLDRLAVDREDHQREFDQAWRRQNDERGALNAIDAEAKKLKEFLEQKEARR